MERMPTHRERIHSGEILLEDLGNSMGHSQLDLASVRRLPVHLYRLGRHRMRGAWPQT